MISQVKIYVMDIVWILCDVVCILQVFGMICMINFAFFFQIVPKFVQSFCFYMPLCSGFYLF